MWRERNINQIDVVGGDRCTKNRKDTGYSGGQLEEEDC